MELILINYIMRVIPEKHNKIPPSQFFSELSQNIAFHYNISIVALYFIKIILKILVI